MDEPVELLELYFNWLCSKVIDTTQTSPGLTYWNLFKALYTTEFAWLLSGDDNRAADGKQLRREFILEADIPDYPQWRQAVPCSVFEMMIAFSRRADFMTDRPYPEWFWEMVDNLGLRGFNDANFDPYFVDDILNTMVWRQYNSEGVGSMFPVKDFEDDWQTIDIWAQFCKYLIYTEA